MKRMDTDQAELLKHFRELHSKFSHCYTILLIEQNLTLPQYALLNQLQATGKVPMSTLSTHLKITKAAVTHLVDRLEKNQFLKRTPHPDDRRVHLLEILPKGRRIVSETQNQVFKHLLRGLNQFDKKGQKTIIKFYALMAKTIDKFLMDSPSGGSHAN